MTGQVLYESGDLLVRHVPGSDATRHVITFGDYHDDRTVDRPGFGERFLKKEGISATHILSRDNDWFQTASLCTALATARREMPGATNVLAYGSSMGAYAAVRLGDLVGATAVLALSPQYSVDLAAVPFEVRWSHDRRRLRFLPDLNGPIRSRICPVVAYDPRDPLDRAHADRIAADIPIQRLRVPFGGHPVSVFLADAGLLQGLVTQTLNGALDVAAAERAVRAARRTSVVYLGMIAQMQPRWRPGLAVALADAAVRLNPGRPEGLRALALCFSAAGRHAEALEVHERILAQERYSVYLLEYGDALHRAGKPAEALVVAHELRQRWPHRAEIQCWAAHMAYAQRDLPNALHSAEQAVALDPGNEEFQHLLSSVRAAMEAGSVAAQGPLKPCAAPEDGPVSAPLEVQVLFESRDLLVRHVPARDAMRHVITFDCYHDARTLARPGFGEAYFQGHGISATHLLTRDNDWFQHPELPDALAAMRAAASGAGPVLAYGSSMGAYAAVRFADAVGATAALALSPQYSIDPAKVPFVYDPYSLDRRHAELIARDTPIQGIRLPFGGHPASAYLQEARLLHGLVMGALDGTLDAAAAERAARAARGSLATYHATLAERQPKSRPTLAIALARRAVALAPERLETHLALAMRLSAAGRHAEALAAHDHVATMERHPRHLMHHCVALRRAGDTAGALAVAHEIRAAWPHHAGIHNTIAELLRARRDLPGALGFAKQALALDPASEHYKRTVAVLRAKLRPLAPHLAAHAMLLKARKAWERRA